MVLDVPCLKPSVAVQGVIQLRMGIYLPKPRPPSFWPPRIRETTVQLANALPGHKTHFVAEILLYRRVIRAEVPGVVSIRKTGPAGQIPARRIRRGRLCDVAVDIRVLPDSEIGI